MNMILTLKIHVKRLNDDTLLKCKKIILEEIERRSLAEKNNKLKT